MTFRNARRGAGAVALTAICVSVASPAGAVGSVTGTAYFSGATCTNAGRQVAVSLHDGSAQGGATYSLVANYGAVTPSSATVLEGYQWNQVVSLSPRATALYVYAGGQLIGETTFSACTSTTTATPSSTNSPTATWTTTHKSVAPTTASTSTRITPTSTALTTRSSTVTAPSTTRTSMTSTTSTATSTAAATSSVVSATSTPHSSTTTPSSSSTSPSTPPASATSQAQAPAATADTSVAPAPKTNPQGAASPLKWGLGIVLALGGAALGFVYFRREFKR